MDDKPPSPAASDSVQNVEMSGNLGSANPDSSRNLGSDAKDLDDSKAFNYDENLAKISRAKLVDSLPTKCNEIVHNSNHSDEFATGSQDTLECDDDKQKIELSQMSTNNDSLMDGNDLDANDNNTGVQDETTNMETLECVSMTNQVCKSQDDPIAVAGDIANFEHGSKETEDMEIQEVSEDTNVGNIQEIELDTGISDMTTETQKSHTKETCEEDKIDQKQYSTEKDNDINSTVNVEKNLLDNNTANVDNIHIEHDDNMEVSNDSLKDENDQIITQNDCLEDKNDHLENQNKSSECDKDFLDCAGAIGDKEMAKENSSSTINKIFMETELMSDLKQNLLKECKPISEESDGNSDAPQEATELSFIDNNDTETKEKDTNIDAKVGRGSGTIENDDAEPKNKKSSIFDEQKMIVDNENIQIDKDTSDREDRKDNDDCDESPDFECSDIREHIPSDEKQDEIDKMPNDEVMENEEDPFDQVVNESMDIINIQSKGCSKDKRLNSFDLNDGTTSRDLDNNDDKLEQDVPIELSDKEVLDEMSVDHPNEEPEEVQDFEASKGADEEICLLPDTEREITEADKERAILAKEILEKEAANKEAQESTTVFDSLLEGGTLKDNEVISKSSNSAANTEGAEVPENTNEENNKDQTQCEEQIDISLKDCEEKDIESESIENLEVDSDISEPLKENVIQEMCISEQNCIHCTQTKQCKFQMLLEGVVKYLCQKECVIKYQQSNSDFVINVKKVIIKEITSTEQTCVQCAKIKTCQYEIAKENSFLCNDDCIKEYKNNNFGKFVTRYKKVFVQDITPSLQICCCCNSSKDVKYQYNINGDDKYICTETCLIKLQDEFPDKYRVKIRKLFRVKEMPRLLSISPKDVAENPKIVARSEEAAELAKLDREKSFVRNCMMCNETISGDEKNLSWETMDFCNEDCLSKYQNMAHANCSNCKACVQATSLGKYCVRFGYDIRQFCSSGCLEEFKKGLKVCSYCQKDISGGCEGFLAPVGNKGQFKDFCSQACMEKFDQMSKNCPPANTINQCAVCNKDKVVKVNVIVDGNDHKMCSNPCFSAFKFVNKVFPDQCNMCKKYYERKSSDHYTIFEDSAAHTFCSKTCMNVFILSNRQIVPCNWCKVKKYNFDMITRRLISGQKIMMCSLNCLTLYQVSVNAVSMRRIKCDHCKCLSQAQYHLTMSDATIRNFCTYQCVMAFQGQYSKSPITLGGEQHKTASMTTLKGAPVPTGAPKRTYNVTRQSKGSGTKSATTNKQVFDTPIISNVQSLATSINVHHTRGSAKGGQKTHQASAPQSQTMQVPLPPLSPPTPPKPQFKTQLIVKPPCPKLVANMSTMCKPITLSKSTSCRQNMSTKECQTDDSLQKRILIPIPVPIYVPTPLNMYSLPYPVPVPIPLPIPVPVFIPTTRNSANGIMKEIKKIHEKMPTDPFEAELLMMAEMVAGDKKRNESDSESEEEPADDEGFSPEGMESSNTFGEDMLQMALKMATEYDEPAVDLESAMTANTITPSSHPPMSNEEGVDDPNPMHQHHIMLLEQQRAAIRGRKRPSRPQSNSLGGSANKRNRRVSNTDGLPMMQPPAQPEPSREPVEKPDANMCLKYTFGVNAWKQWVMTKNADLEKSSIRRKPFKSEILQLTADELNYSLCLFVKEVRKPNGSEYAPDTIYYLVLGIQQYLFENGRIDNIFTDAYYEKFTECLDEVAKKFSVLYNDSQYIVTRVEEEHLWESKQLGAHSPHVLLSTLMFFNTKHFNLVTVEEHMQLSFSHIMKHWKRNPNQPGATKVPGSRNVLLRFYPPQAALEANSRKKKVYEQQENEENPLRCPVKLYEFYLSKCPESVKTRNDVFYLLPERSCVPDSPVWYSTMALGKEPLQKMLHRVKMVKEINIALLTS